MPRHPNHRFIGKYKQMKGFLIDNGVYAAVPFVNGYIIIHNGQQLEKLCRTESSARKYITEHKKSLTRGQLPL
jgi:hypothetical protein